MAVVPARAGVILDYLEPLQTLICGTRASGGDPAQIELVDAQKKWYPRERG